MPMVMDQGSMTQLMILIKLFDHVDKPAAISKSIGITIQGVNYHLKILRQKGLVDDNNEISKDGFSFMETGLTSLRDFVSENMMKIDNVVTWEALADVDISQGERVGIYMSDGYLHAGNPDSRTVGITRNAARKGEVVSVTSISGIIKFDFGRILVCVIPPIEDVSDKSRLIGEVGDDLSSNRLVAVVGEEARWAAESAGYIPQIEFSALDGVFEAATRGMDSTLVISSRRFHYALPEIKELQNKYKEIALRIKYL